jgi:tRNA threonylcarbamoyladenosine biosynthesis protein TsaE
VRRAIRVADEAGTRALAGRVAARARRRDVIALQGALGAGKTEFARGFIAARGVDCEVPSPTFPLVQLYDASDIVIYHFDLYRLERAEDAFELGIEEAFAEGISLIEWPDRLGSYLPRERLDVTLEAGTDESGRTISLEGFGSWVERLGDV